MNIQQLHAKYAAGGAVEPQGITRADIEALVAESLGGGGAQAALPSDYSGLLRMLQQSMGAQQSRGFANGGPVTGTFTMGGNTVDAQGNFNTPVDRDPYGYASDAFVGVQGKGEQQPLATTPQQPSNPGQGSQGNGMGMPGLGGQTRMPYMPTTVYQTTPQMSSEGSWFPINYNPARIGDLVAHLRSQMYA